MFVKGLVNYIHSDRCRNEKQILVKNWVWAVYACSYPIFADIIVYFSEVGEELEINLIYNVSWALWVIFRLLITLWLLICFKKWMVEIDMKIHEMKEDIKNKSLGGSVLKRSVDNK